MKQIIATMVAIMYIFVINVQANNILDYDGYNKLIQLHIIDENSFSNPDVITRKECLIAIMRAIGATDREIDNLNGADLISFVDTNCFSYFECARLAKIAYGEECVVNYPTDRTTHTLKNTDFFFFPERPVTVKESLAFMVRCLDKSDNKRLDCVMKKAKEYGLIIDEDTFINESDLVLKQKDFCIVLNRFLNQKRYKYYDRLNNDFRAEGYIDELQNITYLEFLNTRYMN